MIEVDRSDRIPRYLRITSSGTDATDVALLPNGGLTSDNATLTGFEPEKAVAFVTTAGIGDDELAGFYEKKLL